jgi:hypothetical protein
MTAPVNTVTAGQALRRPGRERAGVSLGEPGEIGELAESGEHAEPGVLGDTRAGMRQLLSV